MADLYGEALELAFSDLNAAHQRNDAAVLTLYGLSPDADDKAVLKELMARYEHTVSPS